MAGLLTPALAAEFSCAYARRMVEAVQSDGFAVVYHNCGGAVPAMLDDILSTGCMAYHFGNAVSMADILPRMPADTVCMGNIDPAGVLKDGTPDLVYRRTLALLEACGDHANFLLSSGCDIPPGDALGKRGRLFRGGRRVLSGQERLGRGRRALPFFSCCVRQILW